MGWAEPGTEKTVKVTVSGNKISLTGLNIELSAKGVFVGQIGSEEMKFASSDWTKPEITAAKGSNFKIAVIDGAEIDLVGVYTGTKGESGDDAKIYCCLFAQ